MPCDAKICEKCLCSHHNNTDLLKKYPCLIVFERHDKYLRNAPNPRIKLRSLNVTLTQLYVAKSVRDPACGLRIVIFFGPLESVSRLSFSKYLDPAPGGDF